MESLTLLTLTAMNLPLLHVCAFSEGRRGLCSDRTHLADGPLNRPHCTWGPSKMLYGVNKHDPWEILSFVWEKQPTHVAMALRSTVMD